jgi:hypothetical protein
MPGMIALIYWLSSIIGTLILKPKLELPIMHYHLLMLLHELLLGVVLLLLLKYFSPQGPLKKITWTFILLGILVVLLGFILAPRTDMIPDGGGFITIGVILALREYLRDPFSIFFWPSLALIETCLLGIKLGANLNRSSVDPIPFSAIATHATAGLLLALTPMIFLFHIKKDLVFNTNKKYNLSKLCIAAGILVSLYLYQLPTPKENLIFFIAILSASAIFLANKKIFPAALSITAFPIFYFSPHIHFNGGIIGLTLLGYSLLLSILVWNPGSNLQLFGGVIGAATMLVGLLYQNDLLTITGGLAQIGFIILIGLPTIMRTISAYKLKI